MASAGTTAIVALTARNHNGHRSTADAGTSGQQLINWLDAAGVVCGKFEQQPDQQPRTEDR